ncbi:hypothetical protein [Streptomyces sp. NPDC088748]|uniref:hypothetical protein n=1 Tax=Streptomyces sp. NPDC088748 TaxID=3365887 RepID=UPI0038296FB5
MKGTQTTTRDTGAAEEQADGFTDEERDAIKERAREIRAAGRGRGARAAKPDPEAEVLAKIAEMEDADRVLAGALNPPGPGARSRADRSPRAAHHLPSEKLCTPHQPEESW